jgi:nitrate reductase (NAD(P)H)
VYDATPFLEGHPGGAESILISAGMDATEDFNAIHSSKAKAMLVDYYIGELATEQEVAAAGGGAVINITADATSTSQAVAVNGVNGVNGHAAEAAPVASTSSSSSELVALNPRQKIAFRLAEKEELSHDTRRFRFALQSDQHKVRKWQQSAWLCDCSMFQKLRQHVPVLLLISWHTEQHVQDCSKCTCATAGL